MNMKTEKTYEVSIYMAGDITVAKQVCRENCFAKGLCVRVQQVDYIYTGGEETGFVVTLIQYPRFPTVENSIYERAEELAMLLQRACCQHSYTITAGDRVSYYELDVKR